MAKMDFDGPIPGENYTSDTKNYPWHRPPEFTSVDAAIEATIKKITKKKATFGILTMLETGMSVVQITDIYLTSGIGAGKWSPDFALLLAGPVARVIKLIADGYGIDYDLGIDDDDTFTTKAFFEGLREVNEEKAGEVGTDVAEALSEAPSARTGGFMSAPIPSGEEEMI